jgi:hypothetical protein
VNEIEVTPVIECSDENFLVGEEILFRVGLRCETRVDACELWAKSCRLAITAPDGSVSIHERGPSAYDGPSKISSLIRRECLNDLVDSITEGTYDVRYLFDDRETRSQICIGTGASAPDVAATFPDPIDVEPGRSFAVRFEITNGAEPRWRMVVPNSCYAASVVGFVSAEDPPSWSRLSTCSPGNEARKIGQAPNIPLGTLDGGDMRPTSEWKFDQLTSIELDHGQRYRFEVAFGSVFAPERDRRWMPRERFGVTVGFVVQTFDSRFRRPFRWLKRVRADYLVEGTLRGVAEARCRPWEWARVTPSD